MVLVPNLIWIALPPIDAPVRREQPSTVRFLLSLIEQTGRVGTITVPVFYSFQMTRLVDRTACRNAGSSWRLLRRMGSVFWTWPTVSTSVLTFGKVAGSACHQSGHCLSFCSSTVSLLDARHCGGDIWRGARKFEPTRILGDHSAVNVLMLLA